ncbi:lytic transglycosylase domain-containing protein [Paracoccus salipaludis]|uniref:Lytic transglycosylase n=1 Tax=Paracoccus salipaludis TaxID=2032623 RepID=A0A2A2GQ74_9RHOB|nr:lytic transglycosylase domain-containing protein [Paracoccus salipaludis]PAU99032.1 lytic transglycosylase [Paracoccus salipaludis]
MSAVIVNVARLARVAALAVAGLAVAVPAQAEGLRLGGASSKSRATQFQRQTQLMDSRLAAQYQRSQRLRPETGKSRTVTVISLDGRASTSGGAIPRYTGNQRSKYLPHARAAARKHGIPEDLFLRLVQQESGWNAGARSHKGATGLAQLMPGTAAKLGVNPHDPVQNLEGGARYLRMMYNTFGDWRLALAAYNAGPGAVTKHKGIPPYRETRNYVRIIAGG